MAQSVFEDWRDKLGAIGKKFTDYEDSLAPKKTTEPSKAGPAPTAKQLGWADQSEMRKADSDPKLGGAKKKPTPKKKAPPVRKRQ